MEIKRRYIVRIDLFIYCDDDKEAIKNSKKLAQELDKKHDNQANVISLRRNEFGSLTSKEIKI